jgi:hypothetical protein
MHEDVPSIAAGFRKNSPPADVTSPFVARAIPRRSSDKRLRKYAKLVTAAAPAEFELCSYVAFGLLKSDPPSHELRRGR